MKIKTEHQYIRALWRIDKLWDLQPEACTPEYIEAEELVAAVEEYEDEHYPIPEPKQVPE